MLEKKSNVFLLLIFFQNIVSIRGFSMEILKKMNDMDVTVFLSLMKTDDISLNYHLNRPSAYFAPTNKAFSLIEKIPKNKISISYHVTINPKKLEEMNDGMTIRSSEPGFSNLYISKVGDDIFINNAKIIRTRSNIVYDNSLGRLQILHIIDRVIYPSPPLHIRQRIFNPDAWTVMLNFGIFQLTQHSINIFFNMVQNYDKITDFRSTKHRTFFLPVDDGMKVKGVSDKLSESSIYRHMIENYVLFTRVGLTGKKLQTMDSTEELNCTVTFERKSIGKFMKTFVKFHVDNSKTHKFQEISSEIVISNIPVSNGVIHVIRTPLIPIDTSIEQFLQTRMNGTLKKFYEILTSMGIDFMEKIRSFNSGVTILAPSNEAWDERGIQNILKDREKLKEILDLHIVENKITSDVIEDNNDEGVLELDTLDKNKHKHVYFNAPQTPGSGELTVEVGGVTAKTVESNLNAGDGVIHIIDHVLGIPYQTIRDKLKAERMFNITYHLGEETKLNNKLNLDNEFKYTYFVPRDYAWERAEIMYPNALKKLYSKQYNLHLRQILDRHLVIFNDVFTIAELSDSGNESVRLPTVREVLSLKLKEFEKGYEIEWRKDYIPIYRADIFCTNGIIHVIDQVLLVDKDIRIGGESRTQCFSFLTYLGLIILYKLYIG